MIDKPNSHIPVLLNETLDYLKIRPSTIVLDATLGLGGHSETILLTESTITLIGIDQDKSNLDRAAKRLSPFLHRVNLAHSNFCEMDKVAHRFGYKHVHGILMDLGLSSVHVDEAQRGFSFRQDGPLDMRFDRTKTLTAADVVNKYNAEELQRIFSEYGEERESRTVAMAIVNERKKTKIETTQQLVKIIENSKRFKRFGKSPATTIFQAIRMEVNKEVDVLQVGLEKAVHLLASGGRLVVISYHSLEDAIVKRTFKKYEAKGKKEDELKLLHILTKKPVYPTEAEVRHNPRARSAILRVVERI